MATTLQNNGDLKAFRQEKGVHDAGRTRAGLLPNPTLELEGGTGALTGSAAESTLSLGLSQEFFLAGKRDKRLAVAELELDMYRWRLADRERLLREEVQTAFYGVLLAEQLAALSERAISLNRQLLEVTKDRLAAGDIPELEMNLVRVELARSEGGAIVAEKSLHRHRAGLWTLMGLAPGASSSLAGAFASGIGQTKKLADLKLLALAGRPDLKALQAEKNKGESDVDLARAEGVPNLTVGLALKRDTTAMEIGGVEGRDRAITVGLKLSMPIPLFDKNQAGVQEARAKRSSAESRFLAASGNVEREVETAYSSVLNADKALSLYQSAILPQLEENLKLTQEAYRLGEVGILALIAEQKKFFEVSDGYLTALHDRQIALVRLESATAAEFNGDVQ